MSINPYEPPKEAESSGRDAIQIQKVGPKPSTNYEIVATVTLLLGIGCGTFLALLLTIIWQATERKSILEMGLIPIGIVVLTGVIIGGVAALSIHWILLRIVSKMFGLKPQVDQPLEESSISN